MTRVLHAWDGEDHVGSFIENDDGSIRFEYDGSYPYTISQSLPRDGRQSELAAANYLKNLLPENDMALSDLRIAKGLHGNDLFSLLDGMDISGGFVYTFAQTPPCRERESLVPLPPEVIAAQIDAMRSRDIGDTAFPKRFSLAGAQSKFTMARVGDRWFAPSSAVPSTHIIKMPASGFRACDVVEDATMRLASVCGLDVAGHSMFGVLGREAYITQRFDRTGIGSWDCRRLHVEDFAQALGIDPLEKYAPTLEEVTAMLERLDPSGELAYGFLRSYMFSAYAGGADAHVKNFSLVYNGNAVHLSPLYDTVLTSCWEAVEDCLALSMNDSVFYAEYLTERTWEAFAEHMGLDAGRIVDDARGMAHDIYGAMPEELSSIDPAMRERALSVMERNTARILHPVPGIEDTWNPVYEEDRDWEQVQVRVLPDSGTAAEEPEHKHE